MDSLGMDLEASEYSAALKHDTRAIQPHGCLVTVDRQWCRISVASANLEHFFAQTADEALAHSPQRLLGTRLTRALQQALSQCPQTGPSQYAARRLRSAGHSLLVAAHGTQSGATLEIEPLDSVQDDLACQAISWGNRIAECNDEDQLIDLLLGAVRNLSGHDQASIHHLPPAAHPGPGSFSSLRMVADTQAAPIPLIGKPRASGASPSSELLALPATEAQRLRQSGIRSILAISLDEDAATPWGTLIHYSNVPLHLPSPLRRLLWLLSRTALQRLHLLEARRNLQHKQRFLDAYPKLSNDSQRRLPIHTLRKASQTWLADFRACGMLLIHGNQINGVGIHPEKSTLCEIIQFLNSHDRQLPWASHDLSQTPLAQLAQDSRVSGMLAAPLSLSDTASGWLLFFRPPRSTGNPSQPWSRSDLHNGQELARFLSTDMKVRYARKLTLKLQEHNATLMQLAHTDPVTQIANRHHIEQILDTELLASERDHTPCSLLLFDIDHFKRINDTHGHNTGDKVLRRLAHEVQARLRATDHLGRWGGEEFLIIAAGCRLDAAVELANRLCHDIPTLSIPPVERISVSIGVTRWEPGDTPRSIIRRADLAMYEAKDAGRSCVRVAAPP
ncbi:diguanylate cyclase [Halomonas campisalis]|uniref:diguanylate cyclase n=1 Tax=Billgrantia campisalis TaxID=74661 RepID=A0ABS9P9Y9_9GAMM|nr:sensor domain-containing diguanylate cyclase [Halomonas campisalis]MCG6658573.1 diguanylate cyclase [Halomonas campisalis]MDR5863434.1 diguanylate cyclase [Halomonas campisalis]